MKYIFIILICFLIGLVGCSKEEGRGPCTYCGSGMVSYNPDLIIKSVKYLPIDSQSITIFDNNPNPMNVGIGGYSLKHSADTNSFYIPAGTSLPMNDSITFTGVELGFVIDTIADTITFEAQGGFVWDTWSH